MVRSWQVTTDVSPQITVKQVTISCVDDTCSEDGAAVRPACPLLVGQEVLMYTTTSTRRRCVQQAGQWIAKPLTMRMRQSMSFLKPDLLIALRHRAVCK